MPFIKNVSLLRLTLCQQIESTTEIETDFQSERERKKTRSSTNLHSGFIYDCFV